MIRLGKALASAAFLITSSALLQAQDGGYWRAESKTAQSVTGDIAIATEKLVVNFTRYTIAQIRELKPAEVGSVFDVAADSAHTGNLYRLNIPSTQKMLHHNTLCGNDDTEWMATYIDGRQLRVAFFSGGNMPVFTPEAISNTSNLCGTYSYRR